jgi:hypothetical protein
MPACRVDVLMAGVCSCWLTRLLVPSKSGYLLHQGLHHLLSYSVSFAGKLACLDCRCVVWHAGCYLPRIRVAP